jgi:hypothetical protein
MGKTTNTGTANSGDANLLVATQATLTQTATIQSLSFFVNNLGGQQRLGVYDATGANGGPGALKATTTAYTPVMGWNTVPVVTPVSLPAGTYWLVYLNNNVDLGFITDFNSGTSKTVNFTFGALPATFPATSAGAGTPALYGTLQQ